MLCPSCDHENPDAVKFCGECGTSLQRSAPCAGCGFANPPGSKFCHECGRNLASPAPSRTPTPEPVPALPSALASGRYQVRSFLGEGAKKRVYLAHDSSLDRDVAVAIIKTEGLDLEGLARVRREAQAMGRLSSHPNIVTAHDVGEEDGRPYIVQEYMEGGSLEDKLARADDHRLPIDQTLVLGEEIAGALAHAHSQGIVHRDLKPGNIWLTAEGAAKLGDFGLAIAVDRSRLTREGMMVGTTSYMPPEQALGGKVTARSAAHSTRWRAADRRSWATIPLRSFRSTSTPLPSHPRGTTPRCRSRSRR